MRKPVRHCKRQSFKKARPDSSRLNKSASKKTFYPGWEFAASKKKRPVFPKGFKKGDFVAIRPSNNAGLEELRKESYVYRIVETCWIEQLSENKPGFVIEGYDPTFMRSPNDVEWSGATSEVTYDEVKLLDVSVLGIAAQKLNDFIQRIIKDGK